MTYYILSMKFVFHSHARMINTVVMEQYALTISAVWLAVSKIPTASMMKNILLMGP